MVKRITYKPKRNQNGYQSNGWNNKSPSAKIKRSQGEVAELSQELWQLPFERIVRRFNKAKKSKAVKPQVSQIPKTGEYKRDIEPDELEARFLALLSNPKQ